MGQTQFTLETRENKLNADQNELTLKKLKVFNHQFFFVDEPEVDEEVFVNNHLIVFYDYVLEYLTYLL